MRWFSRACHLTSRCQQNMQVLLGKKLIKINKNRRLREALKHIGLGLTDMAKTAARREILCVLWVIVFMSNS